MSEAAPNPAVVQERDVVSARVLHVTGSAFVLLILVGLFVTWLVERGTPFGTGFRVQPGAKVVPHEVEMIDQTLFEAHLPSRGDWEVKRKELESYTWADRQHQVVRIPIDRAMQMLVERGHVE